MPKAMALERTTSDRPCNALVASFSFNPSSPDQPRAPAAVGEASRESVLVQQAFSGQQRQVGLHRARVDLHGQHRMKIGLR